MLLLKGKKIFGSIGVWDKNWVIGKTFDVFPELGSESNGSGLIINNLYGSAN